MPFLSDLAFTAPGLLRGHVYRKSQPARQWHVGLFVNDHLLGATLADLPDDSMDEARDGTIDDHGFQFSLNPAALQETDLLRVEVLNQGHVIAERRVSDLRLQPSPAGPGVARISRHRGLMLSGTVENGVTELPAYEIFAMEGERLVGRCQINRWEHVGNPQDPLGRTAAFDLHLSPDLADGQMHRLHVETSTGIVLEGSPVDILAWPNRLSEGLRNPASGGSPSHARKIETALDRLLGLGMPLSAYSAIYPELEQAAPAPIPDGRIGEDGAWFRLGTTGWVICCHQDVRPLASFADRLAAALPMMEGARVAFCDLALRQTDGVFWPLLMPAFDTERLLEQGHAALCFALPEAAVAQSGARSLVALLLDWLAPGGGMPELTGLWHLPHPGGWSEESELAASCKTRGRTLETALSQPGRLPEGSRISPAPIRAGAVFPALHLQRPARDRAVSVIVPTRNQGPMLHDAVTSLIAANPGFDLDIIIVDNGSDEAESLEMLNRLEDGGARILEFSDGFNFSLMNNLACEHARHAQLCFMNNDVAFPWPGVLRELCGRLADPEVGAAGPLMLRASDIIQHGGVVLGPWHGAVHAFEDRMLGDPGYGELLCAASEPAALTGAFLLTRRRLFEELGGFDTTRFAVNFNDVDYCLRLREAGYRIVFSPHARIRHYESVSRGREKGTPAGHRLQRELANLRAIWRGIVMNDPQYHPLFAPDSLPYRALALEHRDPRPRRAGRWQAATQPRWA
ncbi:glycosyltransferase family 2 protein [Paracoccus ravus]|uniref:glycosyltransferase family 2 protein n=1 Tax=Paracoccus ravus TaxID=2447760 RepID=UPI00106E13C5|nr:glycosyltransferase [Paracoccus ravus]